MRVIQRTDKQTRNIPKSAHYSLVCQLFEKVIHLRCNDIGNHEVTNVGREEKNTINEEKSNAAANQLVPFSRKTIIILLIAVVGRMDTVTMEPDCWSVILIRILEPPENKDMKERKYQNREEKGH